MDGSVPPLPAARFPERLHHAVPGWVKSGSRFHVRIRTATGTQIVPTDALTCSVLAGPLIESIKHFHASGRWHAGLVLIMPDHLHLLLSFPMESEMSRTVGNWKRYTARALGIPWQTNFFDHRIRTDEEGAATFSYIMRNPVVKGLCATPDAWPHVWPKGGA